MQRIIMHIDMNSYFATCEQQDNLEWRGKPVGVCEHLGGIIIAASIEAKRWGISTGTPVWEAKRLYPKIILTKTSPDRYRYYTKRFLKVFADYTDRIEKYSIDEAFLDITKACNVRVKNSKTLMDASGQDADWVAIDPYVEAESIAREIKERMKVEVGDYLTCSIGVAWNKLVAKIASDMHKPDGLVVLRPGDKDRLYKQLVLRDIPGIGRRQEKNLHALGIYTLSHLRDYPAARLISHFGILGYHLHRMGGLEGSWKEHFEEKDIIKSIGHVYTIAQEFRTSEVGKPVLYKLCEMVGVRLRAAMYAGSAVSVHVWDGEEYISQSKRLGYAIDDGRDIFFECMHMLEHHFGSRDRELLWPNSIRQIGVTVSGLTASHHQLSLFDFDEKKRRLVLAMDTINRKYEGAKESVGVQTSKLGDNHEGVDRGFTIARVPVHLARSIIRDSIGFGRMKEFSVSHKRPSQFRGRV